MSNDSSFWVSYLAASYPQKRGITRDNTFHYLTLDEMKIPRIPYAHPSNGVMRKDGTFLAWGEYQQQYDEARKQVNIRRGIRLGISLLIGIGIALLV